MIMARHLAVATAFPFSACAGSGGPKETELPRNLDTIVALYAANQEATLDAAAHAAESLHFPDVVNTTFDGRRYTVRVERPEAPDLMFDTETDGIVSDDDPRGPVVPGHGPATYWTMLRPSPEGATVSAHFISWDNSDPGDYLAAGYWLHLSEVSAQGRPLDFENAQAGAFMDGPELQGQASSNFPITGQASYFGHAQGYYVGRFGSDPANPQITAGSTEAGGFGSAIQLTADFEDRTIGGCMGCQIGHHPLQGIVLDELVFVDGATGERMNRDQRIVPYVVRFLETAFGNEGGFGSSGSLQVEALPELNPLPRFKRHHSLTTTH